ncbi:DUF4114 domain-containing protein [Aquabacter spiritensis]|uniref:Serralysin n=1 Tax=Aquabacter spiritensis TaxID=933073 RepID=A0A4R3LRW9_9HYPH|nr:DUF4114 domain-containing protein [Aquabacter spiritensis]TCT03242.1 serralysin [Aquabacter spiritensis]
MSDVDDTPAPSGGAVYSTPKGGLYGGPFDSSGLDPNTRSVMMDNRWTTVFGGSEAASVIPFAFATSATDYTSVEGGYPDPALVSTFAPVTEEQKDAVRSAFGLVSSYTSLTFSEVDSALPADAAFRFARYSDTGSESNFPANSAAYAPTDSRMSGDTFLGGNGNVPASYFGTDHFNTIIHEMGHAFGLKHGHDPDYNGTLAPEFNDNEFSVMTYASYFGADTGGATEAWVGSAPQSYMMFDIAALQAYYGADFSKVGTEAVYTWDPATGQQSINGVPAAFTGPSATGKIFSTVWTQGALTTYDLSAFGDDQVNDLRPGYWLTFSYAQLADLNNAAPQGTLAYRAQGNIYNALLYEGDARSMISNLITGSGNDTITGNDLGNLLIANAGADTIFGGAGDDVISGGAGADLIDFGTGDDTLRDLLADLDGDVVTSFTLTSTLQIADALVGRANILFAATPEVATIEIGGTTLVLNGDFSGGDIMAAARGTGPDAHTQMSFVTYLPTLSEAVSVDLAAINGIANQAYLTGDGTVTYAMELSSATSAFANILGYYSITVDGTISDVHLAFDNTLDAAAPGTQVDLGIPEDGARVGFFLIQNGFTLFGDLPDDLTFFAPDGITPADLDSGLSPLLYSASRGFLGGTDIFHSFATLNPDDATQVLSGVAPGGEALWIGFEDLPTATGDNDFQDVVISIGTNADGLFIV